MKDFCIQLEDDEAAVYLKAASHSPHTTEEFIAQVLRMVIIQAFLMKELPIVPFPYEKQKPKTAPQP